jgi:NAD+ kinase
MAPTRRASADVDDNGGSMTSTSSSSSSSPSSTAEDTKIARTATATTVIALSPRALQLAAEAAETSATAAARQRPPPPGYRFAAACISPADETFGACSVEDDDDDEEVATTATTTSAPATPPRPLPPSLASSLPSSSARPKPEQNQQRPRQRALLQWASGGPHRCLIVKKAGVAAPREKLVEIANWLAERGVATFVERAVHAAELPGLPPFDPKTTAVDFAITLGGDGTVLHLASMFEGGDTPLPPVVCFAMGTLGFLTAFSADEFGPTLERVLAADKHPLYCTLRTRTRVDVLMPVDDEGEGGSSSPDHHDGDHDGRATTPSPDHNHRHNRRPSVRLASTRHVLNECVVDRGAFPHAVYIEIFVDGVFVTAAEADGLVVATPSGSTAYSMSAGGPMVSPSVPCTLLTPLSPQSLSFRPLVIPESSELLISVPRYARSHARLSFDGRSGQRLPRGSALRVTTSACPLPFINLKPLDGDFFQAIVEKLRWNTLIRGRAGERPEPPVVVVAAVEEAEEEAAAVAEGRRR